MELFVIPRYTENVVQTNPDKEKEILQKILKKAEKRKREQEKKKSVEAQESEQLDDAELVHNEEKEAKVPKIDSEVVQDEPREEPLPESSEDFQVLGTDAFEKKKKVQMVLPPWLAHPTVIATKITQEEGEEKESIEDVKFISPSITASLKEMGIEQLFPVQREVIPWVLNAHSKPAPFRPRDICVSAPTGSGKTLAFAIPIVQLLSNRVERKIRALVVLPVGELALQVFKVIKKLCDKTELTVCLLSKSTPFETEQQRLVELYKGQYYSKADIIVTTPGRLVEHIHATKGFCLKSLKFLIIDEADRIMDQVHHNWLYHLDSHVKTTSDMLLSGRATPLCINELERSARYQPHKMLFSATLSQDPEKLQNLRLFQPKLFTSVIGNAEEIAAKLEAGKASETQDDGEIRGEFVGKYTTPAELTEKYCLTEMRLKPLTLYSLIKENGWNKFLCFTNSAEASHRLAFVLQFLFNKTKVVSELSASLKPKIRTKVLSEFARGKINGLISSDALARGIDIPDVDIVISYDAPRHVKTYIHRIGRTGRAGRLGTAITLLTESELNKFNKTLSEVGKHLSHEIKVESNEEEANAKRYSTALHVLRNTLEKEKRIKTLHKTMVKEKTLPVNPESLTFMEKLQVQADEEMKRKVATGVAEGGRKERNKKAKKKVKKTESDVKQDS